MSDSAKKAAREIIERLETDFPYHWKAEEQEKLLTPIIQSAIEEDRKSQPPPAYLVCHECKQLSLRYSSTMDGLRCQNCGAAYLNCKQVDAREASIRAAKAEAQPKEKWEKRRSWRDAPYKWDIFQGGRSILSSESGYLTEKQSDELIAAHNAALSATPPPQGMASDMARWIDALKIDVVYMKDGSCLGPSEFAALISSPSHEVQEPVEKTKTKPAPPSEDTERQR